MIPNVDILIDGLEEIEYPGNTYKLEQKHDEDGYVINGYTDDLDAIKQSANLILNTERYMFPIYSWDYGVELADLIGQPTPYVIAEIPRRVEEALTQDERILEVKDFKFEINKHKLYTTFIVVTQRGDIPTELEVDI